MVWKAAATLVIVVALGVGIWKLADSAAGKGAGGAEARHVTRPVTYEESPPTSGDHHPVWWDCGIYSDPIPAEHAVHSLEHGAVWLTYGREVSAETLDELEGLADGRPQLLLSPLPGQSEVVVATAWGVQLRQESFDADAVGRFVDAHHNGPQAPESGASCSDGTTADLVLRP